MPPKWQRPIDREDDAQMVHEVAELNTGSETSEPPAPQTVAGGHLVARALKAEKVESNNT